MGESVSGLKSALLAIHELTSSHLTWRRLQTKLVQESVACRENPGRADKTDHPVVARNPLPRDFRGLRMPRETSCRASAMGGNRYVRLRAIGTAAGHKVVDSRGCRGVQVATRLKWAFFGAVEKD